MERPYIKSYKEIFYTRSVYTDRGEITLSPVDKLIYFHMLDRKKLFVDKGGKHFESQATIAKSLHLDTKTVAKSLTKMLDAGIITGHKEKHQARGYQHWVYTDVKYPLSVVQNSSDLDDPF